MSSSKRWLCAGFAVLVLTWTCLPALARHAFWAHMTMHVMVVAVAAPLLALGSGGTAWDPVRRFPRAISPIPMSIFEMLVVWGWHAPLLNRLARATATGLWAEQFLFLLSSYLVWVSAFGGETRGASGRRAAGVGGLLFTSMHMTLLGALPVLAPRQLFFWSPVCRLTPLHDQQVGGAVMLAIGGASYLAGGLWLAAGLLKNGQAARKA